MIHLLSDPFLVAPTADSVRVIWFTEASGEAHRGEYGDGLRQSVVARTLPMSRLAEDALSRWRSPVARRTPRPIFRHEATIAPLDARVPYRVVSILDGETVTSDVFSLAPAPPPGTPLKILLTSDHQVLPMVAANLEMVERTVGRVDAVFFAGDLVNVPDRASEWFDDARGNAFFPCLQGRASYTLHDRTYRGGALIQHAPIFPAIGNHEVMGVYDPEGEALNLSYARPRRTVESELPPEAAHWERAVRDAWVRDRSFNTITYEEIFGLPPYYAVSFGDVRLVSLYATRLWRTPQPGTVGRYAERDEDLADPTRWGGGEFIFEPLLGDQYDWLRQELESEAFQLAQYRIVMLHHPLHSLGGNVVPAYTDPVQRIARDAEGRVTAVRYGYPKAEDHLLTHLEPLLNTSGAHLLLNGHCHLWNRFQNPAGVHFLETSNVGNTFGAHLADNPRSPLPAGDDYVPVGDPYGLAPIVPTLAPLSDAEGNPLPYLASNEITAFSILDTGAGTVTSYRYDTRTFGAPALPFDRFALVPKSCK